MANIIGQRRELSGFGFGGFQQQQVGKPLAVGPILANAFLQILAEFLVKLQIGFVFAALGFLERFEDSVDQVRADLGQ